MPFQFKRLEIPELVLIEAQSFEDGRGFFMEAYKKTEFSANGIPQVFAQDNYTYSVRGTLRGLHYQTTPYVPNRMITTRVAMIMNGTKTRDRYSHLTEPFSF